MGDASDRRRLRDPARARVRHLQREAGEARLVRPPRRHPGRGAAAHRPHRDPARRTPSLGPTHHRPRSYEPANREVPQPPQRPPVHPRPRRQPRRLRRREVGPQGKQRREQGALASRASAASEPSVATSGWAAATYTSSTDSARIESLSLVTDRNPPLTSTVLTSRSPWRTRTGASTSTPSSGMWLAMMPSSPSVVRAMTMSASPSHTMRSGATSSTLIGVGIGYDSESFLAFASTSSRPPQ